VQQNPFSLDAPHKAYEHTFLFLALRDFVWVDLG